MTLSLSLSQGGQTSCIICPQGLFNTSWHAKLRLTLNASKTCCSNLHTDSKHAPKTYQMRNHFICRQKTTNLQPKPKATTHTRPRACEHDTSSTLIGGKGGAGRSSLHTTLERSTEYVNARWM